MQYHRLLCDSYRIQTCNLLIRSQMLYSVELRSRANSFAIASAKLIPFCESAKRYRVKFAIIFCI